VLVLRKFNFEIFHSILTRTRQQTPNCAVLFNYQIIVAFKVTTQVFMSDELYRERLNSDYQSELSIKIRTKFNNILH
jgi:hypothetical protein